VKSVVELWFACLEEAGELCDVRTHRDAAYAAARIGTEGLSFLTITLPAFEKDLLTAIQSEQVTSNLWTGFRSRGGLPAFLSGFLQSLFDSTGKMRQDAPSSVLRAVRQVLLLASKIELETTEHRRKAAAQSYLDTDAGIESTGPKDEFLRAVRTHLDGFLSDVESRLYREEWFPRHSSGQLATRESYNSRYGFLTWTERLHEVLPYWSDMGLSFRQQSELSVHVLPRSEEPPVRVAFVPKTMKTPRVIAMEPSWIQFVQQGLLRLLTDTLQEPQHRAIYDGFWWKDQEPNRRLAYEGSVTGKLVTLDLSEASDRVSLSLVKTLLSDHKFLLRAVLAARSERSVLPDGRSITLKKFASMGSALCFPIESMVFYTICQVAVRRLGLTNATIRVFGDDIIVDSEAANTVIGLLEAFGLKVNTRKSFTAGRFRESCGADWFKGENVGVIKLRHPLPDHQHQHDLVRSGVAFHNLLYEAGWFATADKARRLMKPAIPRYLYTSPGSAASAFWSWERTPIQRSHPRLQSMQHLAYVFSDVKPKDPASGEAALRKFSIPHPDRMRDHLERDGRSRCVNTNIGWVSVA
jgi:hypothetical protein